MLVARHTPQPPVLYSLSAVPRFNAVLSPKREYPGNGEFDVLVPSVCSDAQAKEPTLLRKAPYTESRPGDLRREMEVWRWGDLPEVTG